MKLFRLSNLTSFVIEFEEIQLQCIIKNWRDLESSYPHHLHNFVSHPRLSLNLSLLLQFYRKTKSLKCNKQATLNHGSHYCLNRFPWRCKYKIYNFYEHLRSSKSVKYIKLLNYTMAVKTCLKLFQYNHYGENVFCISEKPFHL